MNNDPKHQYIQAHCKSYIVGLFLTLLLGPLGLFYCSAAAAIVLTLLAIVSATTMIGPVVIWGASMVASIGAVHAYNNRVKTFAALTKA